MKKELIGMSRFLSLVLRHKPDTIGIKLDSQGWVDVNEFIDKVNAYQKPKGYELLTKALLDEIVETNDKKRFAYSDNGWSIRASQGHSVNVDLKLEAKTPPEFLYHGTAEKFVDLIKKSGLMRMNRNHVHLSPTKDTAIKVGSRHGKPRVLKVKSSEMNKDGFDFFLSANGVWLVDSVPSKYIDFQYKGF